MGFAGGHISKAIEILRPPKPDPPRRGSGHSIGVCLMFVAALTGPLTADDRSVDDAQPVVSMKDTIQEVVAAQQLLRTDLEAAAKRAEKILATVDTMPPKVEAMVCWIAGSALTRTSRFEQAMVHLRRGEQVARGIDDPCYLRRILRYIASASYELSEFRQGQEAATEALILTDNIDDSKNPTYKALLLNELGGCETRLGNLEDAANAFRKALIISQEEHDLRLELQVTVNLIDVYLQLKLLRQAQQVCANILDRTDDDSLVLIKATAHYYLGKIHLGQNQPLEAEDHLTQTLRRLPDPRVVPVAAMAAGELGRLHEKNSKLSLAEAHYNQAVQLADSVRDKQTAEESRFRLARVRGFVDDRDDYQRALSLRDSALANDDVDEWASLTEDAIAASRKLDDPAATLALVDELSRFRQDQWNAQNAAAVAELQNQLGSLKEEQQVAAKQHRQEVVALRQAEQATRFRWMSALLISSLVGLVVLAVMLWRLRDAVQRERIAKDKIYEQEQRQAALEMRLAREDKVSSLKLFASGIVHDFNNLLAVITSSAEFGSTSDSEQDHSETLAQIADAAENAAELTSQLNQYLGGGVAEAGSAGLGRAVVEMTPLLKSVVKQRADLLVSDHSNGEHVGIGESEARQIVVNLVSNAAESMRRFGQISVRVRIADLTGSRLEQFLRTGSGCSSFEQLKPGTYCHLSVTDNGCGMDDDTLKRVFDPYFSTKETGHGLGMASVHGIVKSQGGAAFVNSREGEGTTVDVFLPIVKESVRSEPEVDELSSVEGSRVPLFDKPDKASASTDHFSSVSSDDTASESGRILVVDDDQLIRDMMGRLLEQAGYAVDIARNAEEARSLFSSCDGGYQCIIADYSMPGENGLSLLQWIRGQVPRIRTVLCSGFHAEGNQGHSSVDVCLQKPFRSAILLAAVGRQKTTIEA